MRFGKRKLHLKVPFTKCKTFVDRSFSVYGPKMWNNLPDDIRVAADIGTFKRKLKTWLFKRFELLERPQITIGVESALYKYIHVNI